MAGQGVPVFPVVAILTGGILVWSGLYNQPVVNVLRDLSAGAAPKAAPAASLFPSFPVQSSAGIESSPSFTGTSNNAVANDALKYQGNDYVWGGAPGTTPGTDDGTDCSGFVNMVVGRDLGMAIPGYAAGAYTGASHGPTTQVWLLWGGCKTIPRSEAQAGDLAVWQTHMGIFVDSGNHMISALDTQSGVIVTTIEGGSPPGELLFCRRLVA